MSNICTACNGDGREHCNNPDHNFNEALGGETARLGCPTCRYPNSTLVVKGGDCEACDGTGEAPTPTKIGKQDE